MAQNHVWRHTLRLLTHFAISGKVEKSLPKCVLKPQVLDQIQTINSHGCLDFSQNDLLASPGRHREPKSDRINFCCARFGYTLVPGTSCLLPRLGHPLREIDTIFDDKWVVFDAIWIVSCGG